MYCQVPLFITVSSSSLVQALRRMNEFESKDLSKTRSSQFLHEWSGDSR